MPNHADSRMQLLRGNLPAPGWAHDRGATLK
jgi:hypothetical protein